MDMQIQFLLFLIFLLIPINGIVFGEDNQTTMDSSIIRQDLKSSENGKFHYLLTEWQSSDNPPEFAKKHNIPYDDDQITVYIYLETSENISEIPSNIKIQSNYGNIVVASVTSEDLYQLEKFDFIQSVTPPDPAQNLPMPTEKKSKTETPIKNQSDVLFLGLIVGSGVIISIIGLKKSKLL